MQLFSFLSYLNCQEQSAIKLLTQKNKKTHLLLGCLLLLYVTPSLNKTNLSKPLCLLRSSFHRAIFDSSTFLLVLALLRAFEIINQLKQ